MKIIRTGTLLVLLPTVIYAQDFRTDLFSSMTAGKYSASFLVAAPGSSFSLTPPPRGTKSDTAQHNMYGDLLEDNPAFNPKSPVWACALRAMANNVLTWASDRYIFDADFARIGLNSWSHNLKTGWEWDTDRFGMNYFFHPYTGSGYFNSARANGYSFYESVPFAFGGSLMWEYFGENTLPSYNDLINTTVTGAFLGEVSYRLSSDFLDDRTTGSERIFREIFAAVINPERALGRLLQGKCFRVTSAEIYAKEPLNMTFAAGPHVVNDGSRFGTGATDEMISILLDYGNPFEERSRKLFEYFKVRGDLTFGAGRKVVDNVLGEGILFGKNSHSGSLDVLLGAFQHYDFWDNKTFELGTIAFGAGVISRLSISSITNLYVDFHLGLVPLAGNSTQLGPDTSQFRDYNYGGGAEGKLETTLNIGRFANLTFRGFYYWIHTYVGTAGENFVGILKPSVTFRILGNFSVGFEHLVYFSDRYPRDFPDVHDVRTEQKVFLQFYIDNFKPKG